MKNLGLIFILIFLSSCKNDNDSKLNLIKKWYFEDAQTQLPYLMSIGSVDTIYKVVSKGGLNFNNVGDTSEILVKLIHEDSVIINQEIKSVMCCKNKFVFVDDLKIYTQILTDSENEYLSFYTGKVSDTIIKTKGYFYYDVFKHNKTDSVVLDTSFNEFFLSENDRIIKRYIQFDDSRFVDKTEYYYDLKGGIDSMVFVSQSIFKNYSETSVFHKNNNKLVQINKFVKTEEWMNLKRDTLNSNYELITQYKDNFPIKELWKRANGDTVTILDYIYN